MSLPVAVVGGGPAGATAAAILARAGRAVVVLERTAAATEKICGEFLSGEASGYLASAGVDLSALGGHPIARVRLVRGARVAEAALPFQALGVSRAVLDEALLAHAAACGAEVRRGIAVGHADATTLRLSDGSVRRADTVLLATGKHDVRGLRRAPVAAPGDLVGFKLHLRPAPAQRADLAGHVELLLFPDCYAGLQLIEAGRANLCLLVRRSRLERAGGTWTALLDGLQRDSLHLRTRLAGAEPLQPQPLSIYRVPYGFVHRPGASDPAGVFRLGDQAAVIPSFAGDGMSIALHSAALAAGMVLAGATAETYHRRLRRDVAGQVRRAMWLYRIGCSAPGQAALMAAGLAWPRVLGLAARLTRVPADAAARALAAHLPAA